MLLVDDDRVGTKRVQRMVEKLGHATVAAHTWIEALRAFSAHEIDLVLMDAVMPTVDGFKLTRILRERATSYVPIVFVAGRSDEAARRRSFEAGADDLLAKPVDEVELALRIAGMLRIRDLTRALEEKTHALADMARRDALTGLLNRRALDEALPREIERARRYERDLTVLMLDVDHFKRVNDELGHEAGDRVLACLGKVLSEDLRLSDMAFRYGGEEMTVLAPETSAEGGLQLAERIRRAFAHESARASVAGSQSLSIGVASVRDVAGPIDDDGRVLVAAADHALYEAKRAGRDRCRRYAPAPVDGE